MTTTATGLRIHLGYEMPTGEAVTVPLRHTVVTGLTQQSGKTTTCEAIVSRMPQGFKALVFRTKRGEVSFEGVNRVDPFYRQESGWEYVLSVLEAAVKQKLRVERSFLMDASRGTSTLREVYQNIVDQKAKARRGFDQSVLTVLEAYFEKVLPQIEEADFAQELALAEGANVMDLAGFTEEVQALVISSCLQEIWRHAQNTYIVIPEAWAFIPQSRGNPVKWAAQHVIRQGAALGVYLLIDSQDVTGIDKALLKSVDCWLLGRQREVNEVKRVLDQLPPSNRPSAEAVTKLGVGQFYVSTEDWCKLVYVQPAWATQKDARLIAMGQDMEAVLTGDGPRPARIQPATFKAPGALILEGIPLAEVEGLHKEIAQLKEELAVAVRDLIMVDKERDQALALVKRMQGQLDPTREELVRLKAQMEQIEAELKHWRLFREGLFAILPAAYSSDPQPLDLDAIAEKVAARLGTSSGGPVKVVAPLEALKHQYQAETVQRLLKSIEALTPGQRRTLEWLVAVDSSQPFHQVCRGLGFPISGAGYVTFSKGANALVKAGWLLKDSHGLKATVMERVREALAPYTTDQEQADQVFAYLVARLALEVPV